jgi:hypothetical protein
VGYQNPTSIVAFLFFMITLNFKVLGCNLPLLAASKNQDLLIFLLGLDAYQHSSREVEYILK